MAAVMVPTVLALGENDNMMSGPKITNGMTHSTSFFIEPNAPSYLGRDRVTACLATLFGPRNTGHRPRMPACCCGGAGMRHYGSHTGRPYAGVAESFLSFVPLFGGILRQRIYRA
jgi:hypothetical protein